MKQLTFKETIAFHGHNGPFLALGYRAGEYAKDILKPEHIKDIVCSISIIKKTPYSCIIDGIQCSTCCTTGKGNLSIKNSTRNISIVFKKNNRSIILSPTKEALKAALSDGNLNDTKQWKEEQSIDSLFTIEDIQHA